MMADVSKGCHVKQFEGRCYVGRTLALQIYGMSTFMSVGPLILVGWLVSDKDYSSPRVEAASITSEKTELFTFRSDNDIRRANSQTTSKQAR